MARPRRPRRARVPKHWVRNPSDELAIDQGCWFDPAAGQRVVDFAQNFCRQTKAPFTGRLLELMPYQVDFVYRLYGWRKPDGTRRFNSAYLEIPKKNGKSTKLSALSNYHLRADGEGGAEIYICAVDKNQAGIVFNEAANMVRESEYLRKDLRVYESAKRITFPRTYSFLTACSADVPSKDGANASFVVFDELHRHKNDEMWKIFRSAGATRSQPLRVVITTAGEDQTSVCWRQHDFSEKVNKGVLPITNHLGVIYGGTMDDDPGDEDLWRRVNPGIGHTLRIEELRELWQEVKDYPTDRYNFMRLRCGIWVSLASAFITPALWDACRGPEALSLDQLFQRLRGKSCVAGLDLSSTVDLTALVLLFDTGDIVPFFWCPTTNAVVRSRKDQVPYIDWHRNNFLRLTDGDTVDYADVRRQLVKLRAHFNIRRVVVDPHNAVQLSQDLKREGFDVVALRQTMLGLTAATKETQRLIHDRHFHHHDNPVLKWCMHNAVAITDQNENIRLDKKKSRERIDGAAALVNAVAGRFTDQLHPEATVQDLGGTFLFG